MERVSFGIESSRPTVANDETEENEGIDSTLSSRSSEGVLFVDPSPVDVEQENYNPAVPKDMAEVRREFLKI